MPEEKSTLVVTFSVMTTPDPLASKEAGRPMFKDEEIVTYIIPGNRLSRPVFPAHSFFGNEVDEFGNQEPITHAMKHKDQYRRFKEGRQQIQVGTPLSELPFLTQAKRMELKALSIYTVEQLASLDGQNLKTLGIGGRDLKNQAQAYIDNATGGAAVARLAEDNASLKQQLELMRADMAAMQRHIPVPPTDPALADLDEEELKERFKEVTGNRPRGNPSRETLVRMVHEAMHNTEAA